MSANNNREPSLSAKPLTTPDPLSAAVEAYDRTVHCPDAQPQSLADDHRSALSAAITAYIEASGMVLVPREPTEAMQAALTELGRTLVPDDHHGHERDQYTWFAVKAWRAMIAASPAPTVEVG